MPACWRMMTSSRLVVCLDNNDYSTLSDSSKRTDELDAIRLQLLNLANSGKVTFAFAGTHLMEMAPLDPSHTLEAAARADLLVALCGKNALISFEQILKAEVARAASLVSDPLEVLNTNANWFPAYEGSLLPAVTDASRREEIKGVLRDQGMTRAQRRAADRKLYKKGRPTALLKSVMPGKDSPIDSDAMLRRYPMRPADAEVLTRYVFGHASEEQAEAALLNGLRDPSCVMRWFAESHDTMSPIIRWIRDPSEKYIAALQAAIAGVQELRRLEEQLGRRVPVSTLTPSGWKALLDDTLLKFANRVLATSHPDCQPILDVRLVMQHCPGLSTTFRCIYSTAWDALSLQPRVPKKSDYADALHALYAPYVSIFRADSYMAPHVAKHVKEYGTKVVGKLRDLPREIEMALSN